MRVCTGWRWPTATGRPGARMSIASSARRASRSVSAQRLQPLADRRLELAPNLVRALADGGALVGGQRSQLPEQRGELP